MPSLGDARAFVGRHLRRPRTWLIGVPLVLVLGALGGPFVYFNFIESEPPPPLSFADVKPTPTTTIAADATTATTAPVATAAPLPGAPTPTTKPTPATTAKTVTASELDGPWHVESGSLAGYRIGETVGITRGEAVGRTDKVTGALTLSGTTVTAGSWTVDMASVKSDDDRRDENYRNDMDVENHPTSMFALGGPLSFGSVPADGDAITVQVSGALTLRGVTRQVTFPVQARRHQGRIETVGSIPVKFSDYGIPNPSNGYARTDDHGLVEFLLLFERG